MKKLLLIFSVLIVSCSTSDDDSPEQVEDSIVIVDHDWEKAVHNTDFGDRWQMRIMATVVNEGEEDKKGIIRFVIDQSNGDSYLNSDEFTIEGGSTVEIDKIDMRLLTQEDINNGYDYVEFVER